jgi:hypothetical protein
MYNYYIQYLLPNNPVMNERDNSFVCLFYINDPKHWFVEFKNHEFSSLKFPHTILMKLEN